jgi:hypothetical protein
MSDSQLAILLEYIKARLEAVRDQVYELLKDNLEVEKHGMVGKYKTIEELSPLDDQIADLEEQIVELRK